MTQTLLIQTSPRGEASTSNTLSASLAEQLGGTITTRDLSTGLPLLNAEWIGANFADADARSPEQKQALALSDTLIAEVQAADTLVIGMPIWNFGVPAVLKAWIDLIARARVTFQYTSEGPKGLLTGKKAYIVVASGGTAADSEIDFATPYLRHALGFIGITDVTVVDASAAMVRGDAARAAAVAQIDAIALEQAA